jgi:outer membrane protein assembly factor BamB
MTRDTQDDDGAQPAEIAREYGPFPGVAHVRGVTYDGANVWFATTDQLHALDPGTGRVVQDLDVPADAGTAFDGRHLFQIAAGRIRKVDPETGRVLATIPAPGNGRDSGLAWANGTLWVGQRDHRIYQIDPETGEILRTVESNRFVTGVTWVDGELWHGTGGGGDGSELRRVDPATGRVLARLEMPAGAEVSGVESDGRDLLFCGGGGSGTIRAVRRPRRRKAT